MFINKPLICVLAGLLSLSPLALAANTIHQQNANNTIMDNIKDVSNKVEIGTAFKLNKQLRSYDITTEVKGDAVTLTGIVSNDTEKDLADEIAKGVEGINTVNNNLTVEKDAKKGATSGFAQKFDDASTTAAIKSKLLLKKTTSSVDTHVKTNNGVVTLTGKVDSQAEKDLAAQIAANTNDVGEKNVKNNLTVGK